MACAINKWWAKWRRKWRLCRPALARYFPVKPALLKDVLGRKAALNKVFARVAGGDEWGVKVFAERPVAPVAVTEARSGKEYLQQKAARLKKRPERNDQELQELATALGKIATDSAPSGKVSGAQPNLLWQATFPGPARQTEAVGPGAQKFCAEVGRAAAHRSKWAVAAVLVCL